MKGRLGWAIMGLGVRLLDLGDRLLTLGAGLAAIVPTPGMHERVKGRLLEANKRQKAVDDWLLNPRNWGDHV